VGGRRPESLFRLPLPCGPRARSARPEGRAPEGLGLIGKLTDEKAIVKKGNLAVQVGRCFLVYCSSCLVGQAISRLNDLAGKAPDPRGCALFLRLAGVAGAEGKERRGRYLIHEQNTRLKLGVQTGNGEN